ncbi:hypothetical protein FQN49_000190, partial [Arthroderma sp. PD_2]
MSIPQSPEDQINTDAGSRSEPPTDENSTTADLPPPTESKEDDDKRDEINDTSSFVSNNGEEGVDSHGQDNEATEPNNEYRYSSSSTSLPGSGGSFGETEYGEGEIEDFPDDQEFDDEDKSFISDLRGGGRGMRSARTSISSLPGSVVVYPNGKSPRNGHFQRGDYRQNINALDRNSMMDAAFGGNRVRSKKNISKDGRAYNYAPQVRDMDSPFRHPSSVRAMQMGDEDYYDDGGMDDGNYFSSPPRNGRMNGHHNGSPRMSDMSFRSSPMSPSDQRPYNAKSSQSIQPSKEYALVLLHCTLLPPSFPLSLPAGSPPPSMELLREILPDAYWSRWKLLEEKIGATGILRDRGILISHPQEAYDLLEERLLETLELTRPRLAYGHFIGGGDESDGEEQCSDADENDGGEGACVREKCQDCGQRVVNNLEGVEKKWEVRVYAANGLMGQGAWAAAWKEMEKVDVEVGLCLPTKLRNELEQRLLQEEAFRMERLAEKDRKVKESHAMSKTPKDLPSNSPQSQLDGLDDFGMQPTPEKAAAEPSFRKRERPASTTPVPMRHSGDDINLLKALFNYIRMVCQGNKLPIVTVLLVLLALVTPSPYSFFSRSSDMASQLDPFVSSQPSIISVSNSHSTVVSQHPLNSIEVVQSSLPEIQQLSSKSCAQPHSVETASTQLEPSASYQVSQSEEVSSHLEAAPSLQELQPETTAST